MTDVNASKLVEVLRSEAKRHFDRKDEAAGDWDEHRVRRTAGHVLISLALAIEKARTDGLTGG